MKKSMKKSVELIVEVNCLRCNTTTHLSCEVFDKIIKLQEHFSDELKTEDICLKCAKDHHGSYWDEDDETDFLNKSKEYKKRGYKYILGYWEKPDGSIFYDTDTTRRSRARKTKKL